MSTVTTSPDIALRKPLATKRAPADHQVTTTPRVTVAGYGLTTVLGLSAAQTWEALLAGRAVDTHARVPIGSREGEPRVSTLAIHAAREAIASAGWSYDEFANDATAVIVGTSKGPVETWLNAPPRHMPDSTYVAAGG